MSYILRKSKDRGFFDYEWLRTFHSFSFAAYHDPKFMGFRSLRVINEDYIAPKSGFELHGHQNMEIITYVFDGVLTHNDNLGNKGVIKAGSVQIMSAGTGIEHSEFNEGDSECGLLQMWIKPNKLGGVPFYKTVNISESPRSWLCVASEEGGGGLVSINQDARVFVCESEPGALIAPDVGRVGAGFYWLQVAKGSVEVNGIELDAGDGLGLNDVSNFEVMCKTEVKLVLFRLN